MLLWRGNSLLTGDPVIAIATGTERESKNAKTGGLIQVWFLDEGRSPVEAQRILADASVCGDCPLRRHARCHRPDRAEEARALGWRTFRIAPEPGLGEILCPAKAHGKACTACYLCDGTRFGERPGLVNIAIPDHAHGHCYVRPEQAPLSVWKTYHRGRYSPAGWSKLQGRDIRIGAYGDPACAPLWITVRLAMLARRWTGYTHQWHLPRMQPLRGILMASV